MSFLNFCTYFMQAFLTAQLATSYTALILISAKRWFGMASIHNTQILCFNVLKICLKSFNLFSITEKYVK